MLPGHEITTETRPARCCGEHWDTWVVCSCGFEENAGLDYQNRANELIMGHRVAELEKALVVLGRSTRRSAFIGE